MRRSAKIALGIIVFFGLVFTLGVIGLVSLVMRGGSVDVPDGALLVIHLSGDYEDAAPGDNLSLPFLSGGGRTLQGIRSGLEKAKVDKRIRGILLDISGLSVGWGAAQEIRQAIQAFRSSGKPVTVFMETATDKDFYVALAADKIYMAPQGNLFLNGLSMEAQFLKGTLDKVGVEAEMHHVGEYKSATEAFTRTTMSEPAREAMTAIVDSLYGQLVSAIAEGRKLSKEEVQAYIDDFSLSGERTVEARMLDGLEYHDEVLAHLKQPSEDEPKLIELKEYNKVDAATLGLKVGPKVAVLYVSGEIASGESGNGGMFGSQTVGSETIVDAIHDIREDDDIRAVVLRIDSPGGSALAADIMWRELVRLHEKKPIIVSMSDLAASGGYWIATASDAIVAQPGTITGSIGVLMGKYNVKGLMEKVGMNVETVARGKYSTMFSPVRGFTPDEVNKIDLMLRETYDTFVDKVAKARNMSAKDVDAIARGRIWTGEQAKERKLVDELGGLDEAIALAREKAKIDGKERVDLLHFPKAGTFIDRLLNTFGSDVSAREGIELSPEVRKVLSLLNRKHESAVDQGPQAVMPFLPVIY